MTRKIRHALGVSVLALLIAGVALACHAQNGVSPENMPTRKPGDVSEPPSVPTPNIPTPNDSAEPDENEPTEPGHVAESKPEYRKISAEEAYRMMNEADSVLILDVRTEEEYEEQHIPDAVLIPDYELSQRAEAELPDKDALILVYCRSGRRSANAAYELVGMGYTNVYDFGGIIDWTYDVE